MKPEEKEILKNKYSNYIDEQTLGSHIEYSNENLIKIFIDRYNCLEYGDKDTYSKYEEVRNEILRRMNCGTSRVTCHCGASWIPCKH